MARVFIAYSRKDSDFVDRLTADLKAAGVSTWRDVDDIPGDIAAYTAGWRSAVQQGLRECTHMVVVLSPASVESMEVASEWSYFLEENRPVTPLLIRKCDIPYRLLSLQVWDLTKEYQDQLDRLADLLPHEAIRPGPKPPEGESSRRRLLYGVAAVVVAVLTGFLVKSVIGGGAGGSESESTPAIASATPSPEATVFEPTPTPDDCLAAGLPESACAGVQQNEEWTPVIETFGDAEMALVPAGCFMMGSEGSDNTVKPVHQQCFEEPFWIDETEVTNGQYGSAGYFSGADYPRDTVNWFEAVAHCEGRGARLPTEAEWEYAARGPDGWFYPWGNDFVGDNVVYSGNSDGQTAEVGSKAGSVSWVGAYDMSGNVWEWVSSIYHRYPYDSFDGREVSGRGDSSSVRVLRGGSWNDNDADFLRATYRDGSNPDGMINYFGFRCARDF